MEKAIVITGENIEKIMGEVKTKLAKMAMVSEEKGEEKKENIANIANNAGKPEKERKRKDRKLDFNRKNVLKAIKGSGGIINSIRKNFLVAWHTMDDFIKQDEELLQAVKNEKEGLKDLCENVLVTKIIKGDDWAVRYYLATQCKDRGYVERQESEQVGQSALIEKMREDNIMLLKLIQENATDK